MTEVECGIKAYDVHELYCHFLADRLGYYADEGLASASSTSRSRRTIACRSGLLPGRMRRRLPWRREGFPFKVVLAAATRPMFWLHARPELESIEALRGKRVATYPPVAPPHWFHRVLLRKHGLDPDRDLEFWPCRDDIIRLGLLARRRRRRGSPQLGDITRSQYSASASARSLSPATRCAS